MVTRRGYSARRWRSCRESVMEPSWSACRLVLVGPVVVRPSSPAKPRGTRTARRSPGAARCRACFSPLGVSTRMQRPSDAARTFHATRSRWCCKNPMSVVRSSPRCAASVAPPRTPFASQPPSSTAGTGAAAGAPSECRPGGGPAAGLLGRSATAGREEREAPPQPIAPARGAGQRGVDAAAHRAPLLERMLASKADELVGRHCPHTVPESATRSDTIPSREDAGRFAYDSRPDGRGSAEGGVR